MRQQIQTERAVKPKAPYSQAALSGNEEQAKAAPSRRTPK